MSNLFKRIGRLIKQYPIRVLLSFLLIFAIFITGVRNMQMATGNETLVQKNNPSYISNSKMEETFGGDSILILFQDKRDSNLLSQENIQKMWNIEKQFQYEKNIFSFMSPASIIHQISEMQSEYLTEQLIILSDGLGDMSQKMRELGTELNGKELPNPQAIEYKIDELSNSTQAFQQLIEGQNNMTQGISQLQNGLLTTSTGLHEASLQLVQLSNLSDDNQELKMKLLAISHNLEQSSIGIKTMGDNTENIKQGTKNTSEALTNISNKIESEFASMSNSLSGGISPDELKTMAEGFITMGDNLNNISQALSMFYDKSNMMVADIPKEQSEIDTMLYNDEGELNSLLSEVIIDNYNALMVIKLQGNLEDPIKEQIVSDIATALNDENFETISYTLSGKPVLDASLRSEMKTNMMMMVMLAVVIMLIVLSIVFKVRWRMLSLGIILVSVIATLGFMGILSVPITMVSMAVFPILIGLGIDYSIQFHNRYEEERSVINTTTNIGKSVAIAVLATVLGFVSLYASPVPMIQDFGKMLTIGVIISFIGSVFLLMPILHLRDHLPHKQSKAATNNYNRKEEVAEKTTILERILTSSTKLVAKYRILVILLAIILGVLGYSSDSKIGVETDIESFMPQDMDALENIHLVRDTIGSTDQVAIYMSDDNILSEENIQWIKDIAEEIKEDYKNIIVDVKSIDSIVTSLSSDDNLNYDEYVDQVEAIPNKQKNMFLNDDNTEGVILLNISHLSTNNLQSFIENLEDTIKGSTLDAEVTGKSVLDVEMVNGLTSGRIKMTIIGLVLVFAALLIIYRNIVKAITPIIPVALIIGLSSGAMYLLGIKFTPITSTLGALVLGMGTEMTIMLMERYIEERTNNKEKLEAAIVSIKSIGKAIIASGLTTVGGFSVLMLSDFVILKDFGFMTVINISLALFSTFFILIPILLVLDRFIVRKKSYSN